MRRCLLPTLLLALALTTAAEAQPQAKDRRADPNRLRLATLNAEFLWDGQPPEDGTESRFPWKGSVAKAEEHMAEVATIVRALDADLLNLVEVENRAALEHFNRKFLKGMGYTAYLVEGNDTATGQDVGLLSRIDLQTIGRDPRPGRSGSRKKAVSKHYMATLEVGKLKLGVVGLHLLAKPSDPGRRDDREAQADAIRRMALELASQGRQVIVWGDFNDLDGETLDVRGEKPITRVLEWIRGMGPASTDDLVNVASRLPREKRYTTHADLDGDNKVDGNHELSMIDHILLSPALAAKITQVEIRQTALVDLTRITDHFPIVVTLDLKN